MSRLVKVKAGPAVVPGTQPIEGDLAESWTQPNDTTYVFKLQEGRALASEAARQRARADGGGRQVHVRALPHRQGQSQPARPRAGRQGRGRSTRYTVRFVLKEPFAWFLDALASTSTWIIAKEAVEKFGDLKKPEAVVGTGPWMLERYEPGTRITYVRNPNYFVPGLPYVDGVDVSIDTDPSAAFASFITGRYDFGPEYGRSCAAATSRSRMQKIPKPADPGLHRGVRRHHLDEARPGAVQGRARAARARHGQQLARGARDQCLVAGQGRPQPRDPRRAQGVVDPDRPAPSGRPPALRARHRRGEAAPRRGRLAQRLQDAVRDDGRLWPRLHGRRPDRAQELEGGRGRRSISSSRSTAPSSRARIFGKFDKMAGGLFGGSNRSGHLRLPHLHPGPAPQRGRRRRPEGHGDDSPAAADLRRGQAPRHPVGPAALHLPDRRTTSTAPR